MSAGSVELLPGVRELLTQLTLRQRVRAALFGASLGLMAHAGFILFGRVFAWSAADTSGASPSSWGRVLLPALLVTGLAAVAAVSRVRWIQRGLQGLDRLFRDLEHLLPESRNLLRTAWELTSREAMAEPVQSVPSPEAVVPLAVIQRAESFARTLTAQRALSARAPLRPSVMLAAGASGLWMLCVLLMSDTPVALATQQAARRVVQRVTRPGQIVIAQVRVTPPRYVSVMTDTLEAPEQVEAMVGSLLEVVIATQSDTMLVQTDSGTLRAPRSPQGDFVWRGRVERDGFLAVSVPQRSDTSRADRSVALLTIVARPDAPPSVRIRQPGRDLIVDSTRQQLQIEVEASDDIGLRALTLPYTKVAGAGERFTFTEGELPLSISKASGTSWRASATLALTALLQDPGDLVVYRARVRDAQPGAAPTESDAFIVELLPNGGVAAAGFALDPDEDRYAVSQQMVILKTERLIAARAGMPADRATAEARTLAGEQRRVRAEFVFMTGGEFEQALVATEDGMDDLDETHEAENEGDLSAGRMANRGRAALLTAIRAMSRAALALGESDLPTALRLERIALTNLQEAFARQRFLMRALSQREQLDLGRRLTGPLDSVSRRSRGPLRASAEPLQQGLRDVLAALAQDKQAPGMLAVRVLQLAPGSNRSREVSTWLQRAVTLGVERDRRAARDSASLMLSAWLDSLSAPGSGRE